MSTSFDGDYCASKDKMCLTEKEVMEYLRKMPDSSKYKCDHCGMYHVTSTKSKGLRRTKQIKPRFPKVYDTTPANRQRDKRKPMKKKADNQKGWWDVALEIWAERPHVCQVSGAPLGDEPRPVFFSHLLPRGSYKNFKRRKDNIWMVSPAIHAQWHAFGPENLKEEPMWAPKCSAYFTLRNEANGIQR